MNHSTAIMTRRSLGTLKGRTVGAIHYVTVGDKALLTIMTALVGLDPAKDLHWVTDPPSRQGGSGRIPSKRALAS